ncbi:MAG: orotidine-5'-phosphate decarboxylase [Ketobacteraceae bacterium]|nr:orotidine-5'-phosphate decarboxylase [Ketobacteraceae bacterium]
MSDALSTVTSPVIVALDFPHADGALQLADRLDPAKCRVKVGKELFTREGPAIVTALQDRGFELFLDLKYHDIPNTVAKACTAAAELGVWMLNVHASGGPRMLAAAREAVDQTGSGSLLIAVTVLTSMDKTDLEAIGIAVEPEEQVLRLAGITRDAGLDGVVCSAREAEMLKSRFGEQFRLVTPGIRPADAEAGDQRRVVTPPQALAAGVDYMVIGRPITQAQDPGQALEQILKSLESSG